MLHIGWVLSLCTKYVINMVACGLVTTGNLFIIIFDNFFDDNLTNNVDFQYQRINLLEMGFDIARQRKPNVVKSHEFGGGPFKSSKLPMQETQIG